MKNNKYKINIKQLKIIIVFLLFTIIPYFIGGLLPLEGFCLRYLVGLLVEIITSILVFSFLYILVMLDLI